MKLNSDLFWELCKEYDVPLSEEYSDIMFEDDDGNVRVFKDEDIDRIFASEMKISHDNNSNNVRYEKSIFRLDVPAVTTQLLSDEFLVAA